MTGAGISTSAGIPDFRSKSGMFDEIRNKYNFEKPEDFFSLETFYKSPELLYEFINEFMKKEYFPTDTHVIFNLVILNLAFYEFFRVKRTSS